MYMDVLKVNRKLFLCPPIRHIGEWRYCSTHS